jgi:hypothetical protein
VGVLVVAVVLAFDPRAGQAGSRPKFVLLVAGATVAAGLLAAHAAAGGRPLAANPLRWPVLALLAWTALSAAWSDHRHTAVWGFPGSYHGLAAAAALATAFGAAAAAARDVPERAWRTLTTLWFLAGGPVLAFATAQALDRLLTGDRGWDWARPAISPHTVGSTLGNPNVLAGFLALLLPVGAVLALRARGRRRRLIVAMAALAATVLAATTSRSGWLGAAAGMAALALLLRGRGATRLPLRPLAATLLAAATAAVALDVAGVTKTDLAAVVRAGPGSTADLRLEVWASALRMAADHPVAGVGPDAFGEAFPAYATERFARLYGPFTVADDAHNLALTTLTNLGAGGLLALGAVLAAGAATLARARRVLPPAGDPLLAAGLAAALVAYLAQAAVSTEVLPLSLCFWTLLGLAAGTAPATAPGHSAAEQRPPPGGGGHDRGTEDDAQGVAGHVAGLDPPGGGQHLLEELDHQGVGEQAGGGHGQRPPGPGGQAEEDGNYQPGQHVDLEVGPGQGPLGGDPGRAGGAGVDAGRHPLEQARGPVGQHDYGGGPRGQDGEEQGHHPPAVRAHAARPERRGEGSGTAGLQEGWPHGPPVWPTATRRPGELPGDPCIFDRYSV